jgi:hypothetical protein
MLWVVLGFVFIVKFVVKLPNVPNGTRIYMTQPHTSVVPNYGPVVVTGSLPEGELCIGNPSYFQIT